MRFDGTEEQIQIIREIAESLTDPVFLVDRAFNVWYYNRAFEGAVGIRLTSRRYKGAPCHQLLGLTICKDACIMKQAADTAQTVRLAEIAGTNAGGVQMNFHITAIPLLKADGGAFGALVFLRDITAETTIHRKYKEVVTRNMSISLSGQIEHGNLIDVIQLFVFLQKTGQLSLRTKDAAGEIVFENGRMVHVGIGSATGEKALGRLVAWEEGTFSLSPQVTVALTARIEKSSDFLLMDAVREKDEVAARKHELPSYDAKPTVLRIAEQEKDQLSDFVWRICEFGVEGKSVGQMVELMAESDARVLLALLELKDKAIVRW